VVWAFRLAYIEFPYTMGDYNQFMQQSRSEEKSAVAGYTRFSGGDYNVNLSLARSLDRIGRLLNFSAAYLKQFV